MFYLYCQISWQLTVCVSSWTWSTDNSGIHCVPVLGVLSWTWHHQTLQPLFIACTKAVVGYKWEYQILYYKVISRGFPDERDCLYYVLMGLNSIPDKQRGGRERVGAHSNKNDMMTVSHRKREWWQIFIRTFSNKPFQCLVHFQSHVQFRQFKISQLTS